MNSQTAHGIVLTSAMVVFGVRWFESAESGDPVPPAKFLIGAGIAFLVISFISDVEPKLGSALAIAIASTVFLSKKDPLLNYINSAAANKKSTAPTTNTTPTSGAATRTRPQHVAPHR